MNIIVIAKEIRTFLSRTFTKYIKVSERLWVERPGVFLFLKNKNTHIWLLSIDIVLIYDYNDNCQKDTPEDKFCILTNFVQKIVFSFRWHRIVKYRKNRRLFPSVFSCYSSFSNAWIIAKNVFCFSSLEWLSISRSSGMMFIDDVVGLTISSNEIFNLFP